MKKFAQLTLMLVLATIVSSATAQNQNSTIPPCIGNHYQTTVSGDMLTYFNQMGINLNSYQWDNSDINCHINEAIRDYNAYKFNLKFGAYAIGVGAGTLPIGLVGAIVLGSGAGWIIVGSVALVSGTIMIVRGLKQKKSHDGHVGVIAQFYRQNKIQ